jgi:hypothetical protein
MHDIDTMSIAFWLSTLFDAYHRIVVAMLLVAG